MVLRTLVRSTLGLLCTASWAACAVPDGHPPVARILNHPSGILQDDNFQTVMTLEATESNDPLDDPREERPLHYQWDLRGDDYQIDSGDLESAEVVVRFRGNRPPTIELTVTDEDGLENTATKQLTLTVPPPF